MVRLTMQRVLACISLPLVVVGDRLVWGFPRNNTYYGVGGVKIQDEVYAYNGILEWTDDVGITTTYYGGHDTPPQPYSATQTHQSSHSAPPPPTLSSPLCIEGHWPLFIDQYTSNQASPESTSHTHNLSQKTYYMPNRFDGSTHDNNTPCPQSSYVRAMLFNGEGCTEEHSYLTVSMFKTERDGSVYNGSKALYYYNSTLFAPYTDVNWTYVLTPPSTILKEWSTESGSGEFGSLEWESTSGITRAPLVTATVSVESGGYLKINGNYVYTYIKDKDGKEPIGVSSQWPSIRHDGTPAPVECPAPSPALPPPSTTP